MEHRDLLAMGSGTLRANKMRSALSMLGIAIGVASVVLLTSIGEGTRLYILGEFSQFGTNVLMVNPGKAETSGIPGALSGSTRKLTLDDAVAVGRLPHVDAIVPLTMALARVETLGKGRSVAIYGVTPSLPDVWKFEIGQGEFLDNTDVRRSSPVAVLGPKVKRELFGDENALGKMVRIADTRLRVIGIMAPKGQTLGFDLDDAVYIPVALAMRMFNMEELTEIDVTFAHGGLVDMVEEEVRELLTDRHRGHEDFTITTQAAMLDVFGKVINGITLAVSFIAGISLLVGAVGIFTMMWISVGERVSEIGLMMAVGATREQIQRIFLTEAILLTTTGGAIGAVAGVALALGLRVVLPSLPVEVPIDFLFIAIAMSVVVGLASGVAPARRAAGLEPVEALHTD
ncbi:MAG: ABC transporter permease [Deltaproteobacteria bacterium]|jgi:putative ABC transport system permease protein|nr:ABC transporter permease [Deltaproteobacteria bacterium]